MLKMKNKYIIFVNLNNNNYVYNVDSYEIICNVLIKFYDPKISRNRIFDLRNCEIREEPEQNANP